MTVTSGEAENGYDEASLRDLIATIRPRYETIQEVVIESLRLGIMQAVLPPDTRLRQEDLAVAFETSRIPIREALRALEYEGLVRSEPHRGFTVTSLDADAIEEIYDLRILLESHAVRLALPLLTPADIADLNLLHDTMTGMEDPDEQLAAREAFYLRLFSVTARPRLVGLIMRLRQEVARSLRWKLVQHSPSHHEAFYAAILAGDADRAAAELKAHYEKVAALLRRFLREAGSGYPDLHRR
jgi:DNA-binding GntR family transcriptional regulator